MRAPAVPLIATETQPARRAAQLLRRALRLGLQLLWFAVIPLLWSGVIWRYLVPHSSASLGLQGAFGAFAQSHSLLLTLAVFLLLTSLLRYWRNWLPGGRYLSSLPDELVARVPRRRIASCESACALLAALEPRESSKRLADSSTELRQQIQDARAELGVLLGAGKWSKVPAAFEKLERVARPIAVPPTVKSALLFVVLLGAACVLALQMRARYLQAYDVLGTSMLPTLTPGEVLAGGIAKYGPGQLPHRGEVIVLQAAVDGVQREVIKRVIGLPGDHIAIRGVHPVINGWPVPLCEVGAYYSPNDETARSGDPSGLLVMEFLDGDAYLTLQSAVAAPVAEYVVKPDEVFVLGDNRSNSRDSRSFDRGGPRGFPLKDVKAKIARVLFRATARGDIDLSSALKALGPTAILDGADLSAVQGRIAGCLALRPKSATPPRSASAALALHD